MNLIVRQVCGFMKLEFLGQQKGFCNSNNIQIPILKADQTICCLNIQNKVKHIYNYFQFKKGGVHKN